MRKFRVKSIEPVWVSTTFEIDLPDEVPEGYEDHNDYISYHYDELIASVPLRDIDCENGESVDGIDSDLEIEEIPADPVRARPKGGRA